MSQDNEGRSVLITEEQMRQAGRDTDARDVLMAAINGEAARQEARLEQARLDRDKLATPELTEQSNKHARHQHRQETL